MTESKLQGRIDVPLDVPGVVLAHFTRECMAETGLPASGEWSVTHVPSDRRAYIPPTVRPLFAELQAEVTRLTEERDRLRESLRPFAEAADSCDRERAEAGAVIIPGHGCMTFSYERLASARAALEQQRAIR